MEKVVDKDVRPGDFYIVYKIGSLLCGIVLNKSGDSIDMIAANPFMKYKGLDSACCVERYLISPEGANYWYSFYRSSVVDTSGLDFNKLMKISPLEKILKDAERDCGLTTY